MSAAAGRGHMQGEQSDQGLSSPLAFTSAREILTAVGEVVYEWSIADDRIRWGANAEAVLKIGSLDKISTGRGFAGLLDSNNLTSRHDAVLNGANQDGGDGVVYQVQYSFNPGGREDAQRLWIEDIGRWYGGPDGRPARAHGVLRVINERYEREQRLAFLSRYDELTGFFNRSHLTTVLGEALHSAKRFRQSIAFMIVGIDNFGNINNAYGFDIADQVLAVVAKRLKAQLRDGDVIGRYSGNKLGLILMNCEEGDMQKAAERFHAAVRDHVVTTDAGSVAVTVSIGAVSAPRYGRSVNQAMVRAQEALHDARQRGFGRFAAYAPSPVREALRRSNAALSTELVSTLKDGRFRLAFQPVVEIATNLVDCCEVLLRLERPNGEIVPATEFVALSESLGLVRLLDHRALDLTLEALARFPKTRLSLNVSAETVGETEWLAHLTAAVMRDPALAGRLVVEITETVVIRNLDEVSRFIAMVHGLGCQVALDDFGAGFTSFRNLRDLNVDLVKIDGSFVQDLPRNKDDQVFVRALVDLARNFGKKTVAEWVQDADTVALLKAWGVDCIQGNLTGAASLSYPWPVGASISELDEGGLIAD
jgi:diguanylate cyclase (GGDEF)-like protein